MFKPCPSTTFLIYRVVSQTIILVAPSLICLYDLHPVDLHPLAKIKAHAFWILMGEFHELFPYIFCQRLTLDPSCMEILRSVLSTCGINSYYS